MIKEHESGMTLQNFLKQKLENYSVKSIKIFLDSNCCKVNARVERFGSTRLNKNDKIQFAFPETQIPEITIIGQDDWFLYLNKPAGIPSDQKGVESIIHQKYPQYHLAHRLDRDTTGVLLFAKNREALSRLINLFKKKEILKEYYAIIEGIPKDLQGIIENHLGPKKEYQGQTLWGEVSKTKGHYAKTFWKVAAKGKKVSLLKCYPETGRTHQIRVHLAEMGYPILGDYQYCRQFKTKVQPARVLLHAYRVKFKHPFTGQIVQIKAPLPKDFKQFYYKFFQDHENTNS